MNNSTMNGTTMNTTTMNTTTMNNSTSNNPLFTTQTINGTTMNNSTMNTTTNLIILNELMESGKEQKRVYQELKSQVNEYNTAFKELKEGEAKLQELINRFRVKLSENQKVIDTLKAEIASFEIPLEEIIRQKEEVDRCLEQETELINIFNLSDTVVNNDNSSEELIVEVSEKRLKITDIATEEEILKEAQWIFNTDSTEMFRGISFKNPFKYFTEEQFATIQQAIAHRGKYPDTNISELDAREVLEILGVQYSLLGCIVQSEEFNLGFTFEQRTFVLEALLTRERLFAANDYEAVKDFLLNLYSSVESTDEVTPDSFSDLEEFPTILNYCPLNIETENIEEASSIAESQNEIVDIITTPIENKEEVIDTTIDVYNTVEQPRIIIHSNEEFRNELGILRPGSKACFTKLMKSVEDTASTPLKNYISSLNQEELAQFCKANKDFISKNAFNNYILPLANWLPGSLKDAIASPDCSFDNDCLEFLKHYVSNLDIEQAYSFDTHQVVINSVSQSDEFRSQGEYSKAAYCLEFVTNSLLTFFHEAYQPLNYTEDNFNKVIDLLINKSYK